MLSTKQLIIMFSISARQLLQTAWLVKVSFSLYSSVYTALVLCNMARAYSGELNSVSLATHTTTYTTGTYLLSR